MKIIAEKYTLEMTHDELWSTAFDVKHSLINSLKTHWINYQDVWQKNEKERISRCRNMFLALGRPELFEDVFKTAEEIFAEFNNKKVTP